MELEAINPDLIPELEKLILRTVKHPRSPWYTLKEAGEYMRCGITTVRRLIDECRLKSYRLDQRVEKSTILIHKKDMDALILCGRSMGLQLREQKLVKHMQA